MITSRKTTITLGDFLKTKTLDDLAVEGTFHPRDDLVLIDADESSAHFKIKGYERWGVTFPKGMTLVEAAQKESLFGYFHMHSEERVYVMQVPGDKRVACYECNAAMKGKW